MIYRIYTEKRPAFAVEAAAILKDIRDTLRISSVTKLRLFNRYDLENIEKQLFEACANTVFAEPQTDDIYYQLPKTDDIVFAVEYLPGQFDQRADSCAQCIQFVSGGERPLVRTARVYQLSGNISADEVARIKKHLINPVESREAELELPDTINIIHKLPDDVEILNGFYQLARQGLADMISERGLAMDIDDIALCQEYFRSENRQPTITEIKMIDTYWSDHCRHTTFSTHIEKADIEDPEIAAGYQRYLAVRQELQRIKPQTLMDIATIGAKYLHSQGKLDALDDSEEINACTVKIDVDVDGKKQPWLLLFKNETHNHPTEIEPFGGAATCVGGAIRDPLSGRGYVYQAMRVTGAADPTVPAEQTLPGKLPQRKIVTTAAAGYSSYGNQIGLATGLVNEIYHPGYVAKRMEIGAVIAAAPAENVRRERPAAGDIVVLLGGRTGRDGMGGATGSSKSHSVASLTACGAEVQKGNAPEERKLQRLFRNPAAAKLIKRCNDFGAGGVSVAIGELAAGIRIDLDKVPKKYEGLDGTELAISESQERMAVVLDKNDKDAFFALAAEENLEATVVAEVQAEPRLIMQWRGNTIVNISRAFLDANGAPKKTTVQVNKTADYSKPLPHFIEEGLQQIAKNLNCCSQQGLVERFDSTIGAATVLLPFGGTRQLTPTQVMAAKLPVLDGETESCSLMAYGFNPYISEKDQYRGAYLAVVESVSKLIAGGADINNCYLTFQEYFEKLRDEPQRWGKPFAALLGALNAQLDLGLAAIGGKDSMSGSFEDIDVPPTLVSFAVAMGDATTIISPEFKKAGSKIVLLQPQIAENGLPKAESLLQTFTLVEGLIKSGKALSVYTPGYGGIAEALFKMGLGNRIGLDLADSVTIEQLFAYNYGSFIVELAEDIQIGKKLGYTKKAYTWTSAGKDINLADIEAIYAEKLDDIFPMGSKIAVDDKMVTALSWDEEQRYQPIRPMVKVAKPRVLIPVFPGTNCEYDTAAAFAAAGADPHIVVIKNLTAADIAESVKKITEEIKQSQIIMLPGGFSGGDEPDGSGKFITAFFRNPRIKEAVADLLEQRDGLMGGVCNGFQALIKLGLVPFGQILDAEADFPTLTFNTIGRHQSKLINSRVVSCKSPWLQLCRPGDIHTIAISHGEGRFVCPSDLLEKLIANGQIAAQYVDGSGEPTMDIRYNPNGSVMAVEAICSPDGRIFGRMGHPERARQNCYKNVPGNKDSRMFESAVKYFKA